jgi:hypothetical protein
MKAALAEASEEVRRLRESVIPVRDAGIKSLLERAETADEDYARACDKNVYLQGQLDTLSEQHQRLERSTRVGIDLHNQLAEENCTLTKQLATARGECETRQETRLRELLEKLNAAYPTDKPYVLAIVVENEYHEALIESESIAGAIAAIEELVANEPGVDPTPEEVIAKVRQEHCGSSVSALCDLAEQQAARLRELEVK